MIDRFVTRNDIKPGASLHLLDALPERQYANLGGDVNPLAQEAVDRKAVEPLVVNLYRTVADYFVEDVMSGLDLTAVTQDVKRQIRNAVWFSMLYGKAPVVPVNGSPVAASPRGYWPILEKGVRIGHALIVPYSRESHQGNMSEANVIPDRAVVITVFDGRPGTMYDVGYSGVTLAATGWRKVGTVAAFGVIDGGIPVFPGIKPMVEAFDVIMKAANRVIDRHGSPHLQVPTSSVVYDDEGNASVPISKEGTVFPVANTDKDVKYVILDPATSMFEFQATQLLTHISAMTGIPLAAFNIAALPRLETAKGLGEFQTTGQDRSESILASLITAFGLAGVGLTAKPDPEPQPATGD